MRIGQRIQFGATAQQYRSGVRRVSVLALLFLLIAPAQPAWAHGSLFPNYIRPNQATQVSLLVYSDEAVPMTDVVMPFPSGIDFVTLKAKGATPLRTKKGYEFHHLNVAPGAFLDLTVTMVGHKRGNIPISWTTTASDGHVQHWNQRRGSYYAASYMFVGTVHIPGTAEPSFWSSHVGIWIGAGVVGLLMAIALEWRLRKSAPAAAPMTSRAKQKRRRR